MFRLVECNWYDYKKYQTRSWFRYWLVQLFLWKSSIYFKRDSRLWRSLGWYLSVVQSQFWPLWLLLRLWTPLRNLRVSIVLRLSLLWFSWLPKLLIITITNLPWSLFNIESLKILIEFTSHATCFELLVMNHNLWSFLVYGLCNNMIWLTMKNRMCRRWYELDCILSWGWFRDFAVTKNRARQNFDCVLYCLEKWHSKHINI